MALKRAQPVAPPEAQIDKPRQTRSSNRRLYSEVVATANENNPPIEAIQANPKKITEKPTSTKIGRAAGLATRVANAEKHPGLAALDEEDLKARRKKDCNSAKRAAKAEQKKCDEARLKVGAEKIAAHEDHVLLQQSQTPSVQAHPPPGSVLVKAPRAVAPSIAKPELPAPVLDPMEIFESDASRADDSDYPAPPSDSDSPSDSDVDGVRVRPVDDVFMEIDEPEESSAPTKKGKAKKQERGSVRASIEAHRQVGQAPGLPNSSKRKTVGDGLSSPSRRSPSRKKSKVTAQDSAPKEDTDEHFNLEYGGIMDDELAEAVPAALKPSQVKVATRFVPNAPMVKIEALDPGLPHGKRNGSTQRKNRGIGVLNLTAEQNQRFAMQVVPAYRAVLGVQAYPWDNTTPELIEELAYIWTTVFEDVPRDIQLNCKEYTLATQRNSDYRNKIARDVFNACSVYLRDTCGESPSAIREHVEHLLDESTAPYLWRENDAHDKSQWAGLFLAPYIIAGMTSHLEQTAGLPKELRLEAYRPQGALALATVAAQRGLQAWITGTNTFGEDVANKKAEEFSETNWGAATNKVKIAIAKLTDKKWGKILTLATAGTTAVQTTPQLRRVIEVDVNDAHAAAYEADSE